MALYDCFTPAASTGRCNTGVQSFCWCFNRQRFTRTFSLTTSATNSSLSLLNGVTYYVTVRITNAAGLQTTSEGDGVTVDTTAPTPGTVLDGNPAPDIDFQTSTSTISANWAPFTDDESGITQYEYAIGTTGTAPGDADITPFTPNTLTTSFTQAGLTLAHGSTYYVTIRATTSPPFGLKRER